MSPSLSLSPATAAASPPPDRLAPACAGVADLGGPWPLRRGGRLASLRVAWELAGPAEAPVVVVLGGISAHRHVVATVDDPTPGWWSQVAGPGRALDTDRLRLLGIDFLGGNGASSGPRSEGAGFPSVDTADQAAALVALLDRLCVERVLAVVGSSYGGMVGLALAAEHPERLERLVAISAAHRPHPRSTAWRSLQRRTVRLSREVGRGAEGMALARGLAMVGYRSPAELAERFAGAPRRTGTGWRFPVEDYLEARGGDFAERFDPEAFLVLSESIDLHAVAPGRVTVPTTLVGVLSDQLVPIEELRTLAAGIGGTCRLEELESLYGHDAFLKEPGAISAVLTRALGEEVAS